MTRARVAWLAALCSLLTLPEVVAAQGIVTFDDTVARCVPIATVQDCTASGGTTCLSAGDICHDFGVAGGFCAPPDVLFCATSPSSLCPAGTSRLEWHTLFVCVDEGADGCGDATELACFTSTSSPDGPSRFPVAWHAGDCDSDGVPNGAEGEGGLCVPRPMIGITTGDDCITPPGCTGPDSCLAGSVCTFVERAAHSYCLTEDDFIFCCGGIRSIDCPGAGECQSQPSTSDDFGFCDHFEYCTDFFYADRLSCLEGEGGFPVEPDDGDCDGDGRRNVDDADPCVPDAVVVPDGGQRDAGESAEDGGEIGRDGGEATPMDAGTAELQPVFSGGGGCLCRAAPPRGGSGALSLLVLAVLWIARRRITS